MTQSKQLKFLLLLNSLVLLLILVKNSLFLITNLSDSSFIIPWITYKNVLYFLLAHLLLVIAISMMTLKAATPIIKVCPESTLNILVIFFGIVSCTLFLANQVLYPQSEYATLSHSLVPSVIAWAWLALSLPILAGLFFYALHSRQKLILLLSIAVIFAFKQIPKPLTSQSSQPNILLIGIDSLRLNELSLAPSINRYIKQGQHFSQAITPLARTYPAWMSILTGLYPAHHGAIFNLVEPYPDSFDKSMAQRLKDLGYQTVYATDEKRFSTIDKRMGFDHLVGPRMGASDFLMGKLNDVPLFNVISQTQIAKYLFPYNYINRASYIHYKPQTFNDELLSKIDTLNAKKPIFVATHLTLTHWPLLYAGSAAIDSDLSGDEKTIFSLYPNALQAIDKQFAHLLQGLKDRQLLKHAIVVILSDHGDASFDEANRLTRHDNYQPPHLERFKRLLGSQGQQINHSFGHGTDVLTPAQVNVALSFHFYPQKKPKQYKQLASLVDIKPTILDYLNINITDSDGLSLKPVIDSNKTINRMVFTETGINPDIKIYQKNSLGSIASFAKKMYQINPKNDYLQLKPEAITQLKQTKQYALVNNDVIVALYPWLNHEPIDFLSITVDKNLNVWSDDMNSNLAKSVNANTLKKQLAQYVKLEG